MNVKDVQNHLDFVRWPQNPSKIRHRQRAWVLRWFPSRWYTSDLGFYVTQWDQQRTSLCQKVEQKKRRAKMDGHQIAHWDGATWQGFHSPKKTCTIFKKSTILQSTHHDQLEASKYQWRFKTYQGRISSFFLPREAKSWDSWLQDAPLDMLQGQLGYGSEHAPAGHVPHGLLLCIWETMWSDFQSQNHEVTTTSQEISHPQSNPPLRTASKDLSILKTQHFNGMAFALVTLGLSCWFLQVFQLAHLQSSVGISRSGPTLSPRIKAFASSADWRQTICKEHLKNYRDPQTVRISVRSTVVEFNRSQRILWNQMVGTPDMSQVTFTVLTSTRKHQPAGNWFPCYLSELP